MKKIEAFIRPEKFEGLRESIKNLKGYSGMSVTRVEGHGRQKGLVEQFRGREFKVEFLPKIKVEIVCSDENLSEIVDCLLKSAYTGDIGDGKIFIYEVVDAVRIRTGERGEKAL
ncbi:MAG: P-II family nitrogen regulator [Synergistetes bacterium]|nr:P-II family nitrogen regulator [Synergistota bacterium]MCX8128013.1 P-II family nitrogen regulator [Synergistota bacterium]MDW8192792.1 P-II family nitrogen regulator [Synergistota bacterium]